MKNKIETESVELKDEAKRLAEMFYLNQFEILRIYRFFCSKKPSYKFHMFSVFRQRSTQISVSSILQLEGAQSISILYSIFEKLDGKLDWNTFFTIVVMLAFFPFKETCKLLLKSINISPYGLLHRDDYSRFMSIVSGIEFKDSMIMFTAHTNETETIEFGDIIDIYKHSRIFKGRIKDLKNLFRGGIIGKSIFKNIKNRNKIIDKLDPKNDIKNISFPRESMFHKLYRYLFNLPPPYLFDFYLENELRQQKTTMMSNIIDVFDNKFFTVKKSKKVNRFTVKAELPIVAVNPGCNPLVEKCVYTNSKNEHISYEKGEKREEKEKSI